LDFSLTEREAHYAAQVRDFVETRIRPRKADYKRQLAAGDRWQPVEVIEELKPHAKAAGLWNLFMPPGQALRHVDETFQFEGTQLTNLEYALCAEEMGRILWSAEVFNCSAPDTGNMEVFHRYGTAEQKEQWLRPLMNGEIRSAFLMTEPQVASSDATNIECADPRGRRRLRHQRPQMVVVRRGRSALQGRHPDGQDQPGQCRATSSSR
jgi:acyl-CoA dehydrogenase